MQARRQRKPADARKAEIVDAALRLAATSGPDRITTQKLADAVGITQAAIFRHFPSKTEIWQAVADRIGATLPTKIAPPQAPPLHRLRLLVQQQFEFIARTPAIPAILYSRELHAENEGLRQQFEQIIARRQALFAAEFKAARAAGDLPQSLCPDDAALLLLASIQGLAMRWSMEKHSFDLVAAGMRLLALQIRP